MKKLTKHQIDEIESLVARLRASKEEIETKVAAVNEVITKEWAAIEALVQQHNEIIQEANEFKNNIAGDQQSYMEERSEKWIESDAGQSYQSWMSEWEKDIDELVMNEPQPIEDPDCGAAEELEELPNEVE